MIGDPILLSPKDYNRAEKVLKELKNQKVILIGGGSGTNKTELAYCLQKLLYDKGKSSFAVSLDDYYHVIPSIRGINRKKMGLDSVGTLEIDWENLKRIYDDFQNHKEIHFRRTHRFSDTIEHNTIDSEEIDYLIIEGLYSNYLRKFYEDNFSIFLEGSPAQTLEFRKIRGKENEEDSFREKVVQKEFNVTCQLKRYAEFILEYEER